MKEKEAIISFRKAIPKDIPMLQYWDTKQHVIDCDPDEDWNWEMELHADPVWRQHLIAELNGVPIGFVQIIDAHEEETHYWGEIEAHTMAIDIWIGEEDNLGRGFGSKMMHWAIQKCFADARVDRIVIDPLKTNVKAQRFYKRLGFEFVEERVFDGTACLVFEMLRSNYRNDKSSL